MRRLPTLLALGASTIVPAIAVGSAIALVPAIALLGCGGADVAPDDGPTTGVTYREDVKPIIDAHCVPCHKADGAAPFSLEGYEMVQATRSTIAQVTGDRTMPPWHASNDCADYVANRSLTDDEIATLAEFAAGSGPQGNKDGAPLDLGPTYALSRVDRSLSMAEPYQPAIERGDDYRCFVLDWPETATTHVTGLRVTPGATGNVHHAIAFVARPDQVAAIEELDAGEAGPGYTCYGGPQAPASWLGVWVPGTGGADYPPGTGIEVVPGSKVVLQVHYSAHGHEAPPDVTSLDLKLDAAVAKKAWIQPWTDPTWQGAGGMSIPAGEADVMYSASFDPALFLTNGAPMTIYSLGLHMHELGRSGRVWVDRAGGGSRPVGQECLLDIPRWDFHWQGAYGFAEPRTIYPGDRVGIECHWDNSAEHQPVVNGQRQLPRNVEWGEGTLDEMCLAALYVTL